MRADKNLCFSNMEIDNSNYQNAPTADTITRRLKKLV